MTRSSTEPDYRFKVVIIGAASCGKTAIVDQLLTGQFSHSPHATIGVDYRPYHLSLQDLQVQLDLWDTAGQETYKSVARTYFRSAVGAILVYDICCDRSFDELQFWLSQFRLLADSNAFVLLVGNKLDRESERQVAVDSAEQFARDHSIEYRETSALTAHNIKETFEKLARELVELAQKQKLHVAQFTIKQQREFVSREPVAVDLGGKRSAPTNRCLC
jgi:small GTP-binding protein